ncbi:MAG: hypothetical protein ISS52_02335 [Dehalococcoidia bacterium]|nr:hypothetical protein [Dehalococcoidia bacterium]
MTEGEARKYGLTWCQGTQIPCAWDAQQNPTKFCFQKPEEPPPSTTQCPQGCFCADPAEADKAGYEWCLRNGDEIPCGDGRYCFRERIGTPRLK